MGGYVDDYSLEAESNRFAPLERVVGFDEQLIGPGRSDTEEPHTCVEMTLENYSPVLITLPSARKESEAVLDMQAIRERTLDQSVDLSPVCLVTQDVRKLIDHITDTDVLGLFSPQVASGIFTAKLITEAFVTNSTADQTIEMIILAVHQYLDLNLTFEILPELSLSPEIIKLGNMEASRHWLLDNFDSDYVDWLIGVKTSKPNPYSLNCKTLEVARQHAVDFIVSVLDNIRSNVIPTLELIQKQHSNYLEDITAAIRPSNKFGVKWARKDERDS